MKKFIFLFCIIVLMIYLVPIAKAGESEAEESTSIRILREKGIITDEEYEQAKKEIEAKQTFLDKIDVGYAKGKGFYLKTKDDKFSLTLGARLQVRYTFNNVDEGRDEERDDSQTFTIKRARLFLTGHAYEPWLKYKIQFDAAKDDVEMKDWYIDVAKYKYASLRLGQYKVPFGRQEITSSGEQQFVDRSEVSDEFTPSRDIGLSLFGAIQNDLFEYAIGIFNGQGQNAENKDNEMMYAARITFNPFGAYNQGEWGIGTKEAALDRPASPKLSLGANWYFTGDDIDINDDDKKEDVDINGLGADIDFQWRDFSFRSEYFWRNLEVSRKSLADDKSFGFYTQAGYFIIPQKLEAVARYGYLDPHFNISDQTDIKDLKKEHTLGLNYYFEKHNLKVQADYSYLTAQDIGGNDKQDNRFRVQFQIKF